MRQSTAPTATVSSGSTRISAMVPATGEGTSVSTLSVETSTIVSSTAMESPTALCHSRTVPSVTDSPICGKATSTIRPTAELSSDAPLPPPAGGAPLPMTAESRLSAPSPEASPSPLGASGSPPTSISPSTVPTGTVSSGSTRIFVSTPSAGEGTSASTLSVETSSSVSSSSTASPTAFVHSSTVPSVTDSPIWGIVICTVVRVDIGKGPYRPSPVGWAGAVTPGCPEAARVGAVGRRGCGLAARWWRDRWPAASPRGCPP